jgi:putative colanic acid biosynthesis acetyltransferase WcaF
MTSHPRSEFAGPRIGRVPANLLPQTAGNSANWGAAFRASPHPLSNRLARALWGSVWLILFRPSTRLFRGWRRFLLRSFGARIGRGAVIHASARIWAPWNLEMGPHSCLGPHVDCYSVDAIRIGAYATVSQYGFLCAATHDPDSAHMTLITAPIVIGDHAWLAADVFIGPGVAIGEGATIGARSSVFKNVPDWTIAMGTPARAVRKRARAVADAIAEHGRGQREQSDPPCEQRPISHHASRR